MSGRTAMLQLCYGQVTGRNCAITVLNGGRVCALGFSAAMDSRWFRKENPRKSAAWGGDGEAPSISAGLSSARSVPMADDRRHCVISTHRIRSTLRGNLQLPPITTMSSGIARRQQFSQARQYRIAPHSLSRARTRRAAPQRSATTTPGFRSAPLLAAYIEFE